jgi:hypothetical protein
MSRVSKRRERIGQRLAAAAMLASGLYGTEAMAYQFNAGPDWVMNFDNSITYNLGIRARERNDLLGNDFINAESEYKFNQGSIITNRVQDLMEIQGIYQNRMGFRFSGSAWKDFAYDDDDKTNPGVIAPAGTGPNAFPAITYNGVRSYTNGQFSDYTHKYHVEGYELLDAFAFYNTDLEGKPLFTKVGRFSTFWGNGFLFPFQAISYSQQPIDEIKGFSAPGSEVKELFLPRTQLSMQINPRNDLSIAGQYYFEFSEYLYPQGGTYFGPASFVYDGPNQGFLGPLPATLFGLPAAAGYAPFTLPQGQQNRPSGTHANYGLRVTWSPEWVKGDLGFYFRHFDESSAAVIIDPANNNYHLAFNRNITLYGMSYERAFGPISTGFELSYRHHQALATGGLLTPGAADGPPTGSITNYIANALIQLGQTRFYQTGNLILELAGTHLNSVDRNANAAMYGGCGYNGNNGGWMSGCKTNNADALGFIFDPQWLQVFPGIDIDTPISDYMGLYGNGAFLNGGFYGQKNHIYSFGVKATYKNDTSVGLAYNAIYGRAGDIGKLPSGLPYYASGNGLYNFSDRGWVSLTVKTSF